MTTEIETSRVSVEVADGTKMDAFLAQPKARGPFPAVLLFQEAFGVNAHIRDVAGRLAKEGFVTLAPELYHRLAPGFSSGYKDVGPALDLLSKLTVEGQVADIKAAHEWLSKQVSVRPTEVSAVGFCMGGRTAFLASATVSLKAAVSFYGGGIAPALLDKAADVFAPLLLLWGGLDKHIPPEQIRQLCGELTRHGKPFVNAEFSSADHGFFCDSRSSFQPETAKQAWVLTLQFLREPHPSSAAPTSFRR
jgi:carboxymethylenebutenolidase